MATDVSICSDALLMLGAAPIASFTESTQAARVASNLYPTRKKAFLRGHPWNAATRRVQLAPQATAPAFGWASSFLLPAECVRVMSAQFGDVDIEHKIEGRTVLADCTALNLIYITNLDVDQWDDTMVRALTLDMAAAMAYAITKSATLAGEMSAQAANALRQAKGIDGQEGTPEGIDDAPFMAARYAGGGF